MPKDILSLLELNLNIKKTIKETYNRTFWVRAETSDVRHHRNGHCYLEFVEKEKDGQSIIAKARGSIWASTYGLLKPYFEKETGQAFTSGIVVLVCVSVEFHEAYGFSLVVTDIDPSYTIGEISRNRMIVLNRLKEEGVLYLNKELVLPEPINRIAVISSPTAAGYEDFHNHLEHNQTGVIFYTKLFPAIMQGDRSEQSIIDALEEIYKYIHLFDVVVIIRGGGSTSDLSCFDSYLLATNCAQFPLPIISGVGHERDVTVLDEVAHTRAKTPTAAAEFLINKANDAIAHLYNLQERLILSTKEALNDEDRDINILSRDIFHHSKSIIQLVNSNLRYLKTRMIDVTKNCIKKEDMLLHKLEHFISLSKPEVMLRRGYSITTKNGKTIKSIEAINIGDTIETTLIDGVLKSEIKNKMQ